MDINSGNPAQGTALIVWLKNTPTSANQLWFNNGDGTLRSKLNQYEVAKSGLCLTFRYGPIGTGSRV